MVVIDGENLIFGRVASQIAKKLLAGEEVHLINSEKIIFTGNPRALVERYLVKRRLQNKASPEHSPKFPKTPHMFVKRLVRGMLPWKKARGREAYKRLFVYLGNPKNLASAIRLENAQFDKGTSKYIYIRDVCRAFGYSG